MADGPEGVDGTYEYRAKSYRIEEHDHERWFVYDGEHHLGVVEHPTDPDGHESPLYVGHAAGSADRAEAEPPDGWRHAIEYLIDHSA